MTMLPTTIDTDQTHAKVSLFHRFIFRLRRALCFLAPKVPLIIIIAIGLVPLTWFREGLPFAYYDGEVPLPPYYGFGRTLSMWDQWSPPGVIGVRELPGLPYIGYFVLLGKLGVPVYISQAFYIVALNLVAGLSTYRLFLELFDIPYKQWGALAAALFYMNNMFLNQTIWAFLLMSVYALYALLPLMVLLYVKGLSNTRPLKYAILIALVSVVTAAAGSDPPFYYPLLLIFSGYAVFFVLNAQSCRPALIRVLWFSSLVGIVALLVHAWWWIPFVAEQRSVLTTMIGSRDAIGSSSLKVLLENSAMSSFKNLFQTLGSAPFYHRFPTGRGIETWTPYPPVFAALSFTLLSFLFPIISLAGLLHSWSRRHAFLITGLFVALLFIMKAAHPPFGELFEWIAATPFGATLRTTYNKFGMGMAFVYAFAVGLGIVWLSGATYGLFRRLAAHAAKPLTAILVGSVCFSMFGLFGYLYLTGEVIPGPTALKAGARVEVPAYYGEADLWLQRQGTGFRVLNLPLTRLFYAAFEFKNGYWGVDPSLWLFRTPVIARITDETTYAAPLYLAQHLIDNSTPNQKRNMACLAGLLNVRYVMLHGDTNWAYVQGMPWWVTKPTDMTEDYLARSLDYQAGFHKATTIGKLHYYENDLYVPMAYAASNLTYLRGDLPQMEEVLNTCDPARPPAIFLSDLQPQLDAEASRLANRWTEDIMPPPQVTLAQVSPTLYKAHVRGASQPFMLVFSQSYHEGWNATIDGTPIPSHFMVNGYANAWFVEHPGDSDITIQFGPQKYLLFSGMLSAIGILGLLSGLVVLLLWRKKVRYGQH